MLFLKQQNEGATIFPAKGPWPLVIPPSTIGVAWGWVFSKTLPLGGGDPPVVFGAPVRGMHQAVTLMQTNELQFDFGAIGRKKNVWPIVFGGTPKNVRLIFFFFILHPEVLQPLHFPHATHGGGLNQNPKANSPSNCSLPNQKPPPKNLHLKPT